ncbi:MOSC domain-containing protein [Baekduia sp. Peel2402]|uniref:MOSC domain-containing protein n=1 Tax=Baekduia sp. Peel2402 TaxID=3458296 RepID=UPI00403EE177
MSFGAHTLRSTRAACIAQVLGVMAVDVPLDEEEQRAYLAERGVGLVPVGSPESFAWPGSWIALRPERVSGEPRAVVMFGVPSGPIWDPAETTDAILAGFVVAPSEIATWSPPPRAEAVDVGTVQEILIAPDTTAPVRSVPEAEATTVGLRGDRYEVGRGTFASGRPGSALTLVDAAVLEALPRPIDHRRNVVVRGTDLNALVGVTFTLGGATCRGRRLCEPCAHLDRLNGGGILRPLVHRGGLRADVVAPGVVRVGDALTPQPL